MEVHPPHTPIHSVKEFVIHILAITVGLLIALGLEAGVETVHHRNQVAEARATLQAEVTANQHELQVQLTRLGKQQSTLDAMLGAMSSHGQGKPEDLHLNISVASLLRASYETAQTSGTLALMSNKEERFYAETYQMQTIFEKVQERAVLDSEMALVSALPGPFNSMAGVGELPAPELRSLSEKIRNYRTMLVLYIAAGKELDRQYAKSAKGPND